MSETVLELVEVSKIFNEHSSSRLTIFQNMNLKIKNSELVGIIAPSGTGKTSLLNISGLLDLPTNGEVKIIDNNTRALSIEMRNNIRRKHIGFVFQSGNLINEFNHSIRPLNRFDASGECNESMNRVIELNQFIEPMK